MSWQAYVTFAALVGVAAIVLAIGVLVIATGAQDMRASHRSNRGFGMLGILFGSGIALVALAALVLLLRSLP